MGQLDGQNGEFCLEYVFREGRLKMKRNIKYRNENCGINMIEDKRAETCFHFMEVDPVDFTFRKSCYCRENIKVK